MLKLQKFIQNNKNWEEILQKEPYCLTINRDDDYIIFKYSQINSGFNNDIVRECRGLILKDKTYEAICVPFYKFGNYGEAYADVIDWSTAKVQEKIDGSLIKVFYDNGEWHVATNGMINAKNAEISGYCRYKNFYELFEDARCFDYDKLDKDCTYMFELTSPYNQVVIRYDDIKIWHIGTRNNKTLKELDVDIGVEKPKYFNLHTLDDCVEFCKTFRGHEGFVVVDKNYNRIKIKNPAYVAMHHAVNNHCLTLKRIITIVDVNETAEFINYFPQYKDEILKIKSAVKAIKYIINSDIEKLSKRKFSDRKEYALFVNKCLYPVPLFAYIDGRINNANDFWNNANDLIKEKMAEKMLKILEKEK